MMTNLPNLILALQRAGDNLPPVWIVNEGVLERYWAMTLFFTGFFGFSIFVLLYSMVKDWKLKKSSFAATSGLVLASIFLFGLIGLVWTETLQYHAGSSQEIQQAKFPQDLTQSTCMAIFQGFRDQRFHVLDSRSQDLVESRCGAQAFLQAANGT